MRQDPLVAAAFGRDQPEGGITCEPAPAPDLLDALHHEHEDGLLGRRFDQPRAAHAIGFAGQD
jgi:hypothetical protein